MNLEKQINNQSSKIEKREKPIFNFKELRKKGYGTIAAASIFLHGCAAIPVKKPFIEAMPHSEKEKLFSDYGIGNLEELEKYGKVRVLITGDKYLVVLKQIHHGVTNNSYGEEVELIIKTQDQIEQIMNSLNTDTFIAEGLFHESTTTPEIVKHRAIEVSNLIKKSKEEKSHSNKIAFIKNVLKVISQGVKRENNDKYNIIYQNMLLITTLLSKEDVTYLFNAMYSLEKEFSSNEELFFLEFFHLLIRKNYLNNKNIESGNYTGAYFNKWLNNQVKLLSPEHTRTRVKINQDDVTLEEFTRFLYDVREDEVLSVANEYFSKNSQSKFIPVVFGKLHNWDNNVNKFNNNDYDYKLGLIECTPMSIIEE